MEDSPRAEPRHGAISGVYFYPGQGILVDSLMFASCTILLVSKMTGPKRFPPTFEEDTSGSQGNTKITLCAPISRTTTNTDHPKNNQKQLILYLLSPVGIISVTNCLFNLEGISIGAESQIVKPDQFIENQRSMGKNLECHHFRLGCSIGGTFTPMYGSSGFASNSDVPLYHRLLQRRGTNVY